MTQRPDIARGVRNFISENFIFDPSFTLGDNDSFLEGGIIDSTGILELVSFLQQSFGIEVSDADMIPENLDSIDNISVYVCRKLSSKMEANSSIVQPMIENKVHEH